jgi:hypothetical protein
MLNDFYRGDTYRLELEFEEPINGASIYLTLKRRPDDADADALVTAQAVLGAPDGTGDILTAVVEIAPAVSRGLPLGTVHYDIEHTSAGGDVTTLAAGTLRILRDIRQGG